MVQTYDKREPDNHRVADIAMQIELTSFSSFSDLLEECFFIEPIVPFDDSSKCAW